MSGIEHNVAQAVRRAIDVPRQFRFAAANAINDTLFQVQQAERRHMRQVFDRPTPYAISGVAYSKATPDQLAGEVFVREDGEGGSVAPAKPLRAEVSGGMRRAKRSERLLQKKGLLPQGWLTVPGKAARLDTYGNMQRGQILRVLAWFEAYGATTRSGKAQRNNTTDRGRQALRRGTARRAGVEYFAIAPGDRTAGLRPGIYERQLAGGRFVGPARRPRAVLVFVTGARYRRLMQWRATAAGVVEKVLSQRMVVRLQQALASARAITR